MTSALEMLSEEHQNILKVIQLLMDEASFNQDKEINTELFQKIISFFREYADKFHHAKEEDILFIELRKDDVSMHCDPTEQMEHEHVLGRNFVNKIEEGLNELNKEKISDNAFAFANMLREHISKEDHILYPMAEQALSQEKKDAILEEFNEVQEKFSETNEKQLNFVKKL